MDEEIKVAYADMLKTLERIKNEFDSGYLMVDPAYIKDTDLAMVKLVQLINQLTLAIYKGRQSYDKILY